MPMQGRIEGPKGAVPCPAAKTDRVPPAGSGTVGVGLLTVTQ